MPDPRSCKIKREQLTLRTQMMFHKLLSPENIQLRCQLQTIRSHVPATTLVFLLSIKFYATSQTTFLSGDHMPKPTSDRCHGEGRSLALKIRLDGKGLQVHQKPLRIIFGTVIRRWSDRARSCRDGIPRKRG